MKQVYTISSILYTIYDRANISNAIQVISCSKQLNEVYDCESSSAKIKREREKIEKVKILGIY
jgi:hypothetical protein